MILTVCFKSPKTFRERRKFNSHDETTLIYYDSSRDVFKEYWVQDSDETYRYTAKDEHIGSENISSGSHI